MQVKQVSFGKGVAARDGFRVQSAPQKPVRGPRMLNHLEVSGYRGFKSYHMAGLTQVNLFVGKNNSGKTALLEGTQLLTSGGAVEVLTDIALRRGEIAIRAREGTVIDAAHFFNGHVIGPDSCLKIGGDNGHYPVTVSVAKIKADSEEHLRVQYPLGTYLKVLAKKRETAAAYLRLAPDGTVSVDNIPPEYRRHMRRAGSGPVRFIGTDSLDAMEMSQMWDAIAINRQEKQVAESLKIIEPDIQDIGILTGALSSGYSAGVYPARGGIVVGMDNLETRVPLGSMGDGVRRLLALATALSFTKNSYLFIDEIDTGLHYSIMKDMWRLVVDRAIEGKIQVFATTHSWDCIEGLSKLCAADPSVTPQVSIHKIDRALDRSVAFSGEAIETMVRSHIDPR